MYPPSARRATRHDSPRSRSQRRTASAATEGLPTSSPLAFFFRCLITGADLSLHRRRLNPPLRLNLPLLLGRVPHVVRDWSDAEVLLDELPRALPSGLCSAAWPPDIA